MIRITNNWFQDVRGFFDSVEYHFPKGEGVVVEDEVAEFLFGFGQDSKHNAFNRLGIYIPQGDMKEAHKVLQQFSFEPVEATYTKKGADPEPDSADERPLVNGGVGKGGGKPSPNPSED